VIKSEYRPHFLRNRCHLNGLEFFSSKNIYLKSNYIHTLEQCKNGVKTLPNPAEKNLMSNWKIETLDLKYDFQIMFVIVKADP